MSRLVDRNGKRLRTGDWVQVESDTQGTLMQIEWSPTHRMWLGSAPTEPVARRNLTGLRNRITKVRIKKGKV